MLIQYVHEILINRIIDLNEGTFASPHSLKLTQIRVARPTVAMATGGAGFSQPSLVIMDILPLLYFTLQSDT